MSVTIQQPVTVFENLTTIGTTPAYSLSGRGIKFLPTSVFHLTTAKPYSQLRYGEVSIAVGKLTQEISELKAAIQNLTLVIANFDGVIPKPHATSPTQSRRRISNKQAKTLIKAIFENKHGETIYPSDIAAELEINYERALKLITELEADGKIARI